MGCLFILISVFTPRIAIILLWLFTPVVNKVFSFWLWPLLGLIFLPFTTLFYILLAAAVGPITFWGWLLILLGFLIDVRGYFDAYNNRSNIPGMPV